jgi:hypothetical protein
MSSKSVILLIYDHHKLLDLIMEEIPSAYVNNRSAGREISHKRQPSLLILRQMSPFHTLEHY